MQTALRATGWQERALAGSPNFLNDLRERTATWSDLWAFYREHPAGTAAMLALMGYFHIYHSGRYDLEGSVLDPGGKVYPQLRDWAAFVVASDDLIPEEALRDSLSALLGLSLITPLYYEVAFSVYLEASLARELEAQTANASTASVPRADGVAFPQGRMAVRLPERERLGALAGRAQTPQVLSGLLARHYLGWDEAYSVALGDGAAERFDEGGEA